MPVQNSLSFQTSRTGANLKDCGEGRCIFLITHRLSTIRHANQVIYLTDGKIAACGDHDDLMATSAAYRNFVAAEVRTDPGIDP